MDDDTLLVGNGDYVDLFRVEFLLVDRSFTDADTDLAIREVVAIPYWTEVERRSEFVDHGRKLPVWITGSFLQ